MNRRLPLLLFLFFFLLQYHTSQAVPTTQGYRCSSTNTTTNATAAPTYPCQTYVFYRAASPNFLDLASIGDLFSVSRRMISVPSNISSPSSPLIPNQSLLIPITCGCHYTPNLTHSISYANLTYNIRFNDNFWFVSTSYFQNLTTYQSVEAVNPTLIPINLTIGSDVPFPIFCKCPNRTQVENGVNYLISYVLQPSDNLGSVASKLGSTRSAIVDANGNSSFQDYDTVFVPVSRLPKLRQPTVATQNGTNSTSSSCVKNEHKGAVVGLAVGLGVCVVLLCLVCGLWAIRERVFSKRKGEEEEAAQARVGSLEVEKKTKELESDGKGSAYGGYLRIGLLADVSETLDRYRVFEVEDLKRATDGFDDKCVIQGSSVYKGSIGGQILAIKKMKWNAFEELKVLQKVNHGNLVKLEGFCIDPEDASCYLVYEYVENGSLYSWLHERKKGKHLNWKARLGIAIDVANGLQYIHEHTRPQVVHKDIKSSNILLDSDMRAKIANFGLARSGCNAITMHIVGTQGYMAPEYIMDGVVSSKMDVFSFGVVLLELVTGKEALSNEGGKALWMSAQGVAVDSDDEEDETEEKVMLRDWMDKSLLEDPSCTMDSVMTVMELAISCVSKDPNKRPCMVEIVYTLSKSDDMFLDINGKDG